MRYRIFRLRFFPVLIVLLLLLLLMLNPKPCREGTVSGLLLCGRVIIPSLFPFTFCVLFIMKSGILEKIRFLKPVTEKIFGLSHFLFSLVIMSFLGGYPVGAKLLNNCVEEKRLEPHAAGMMLNFCINAGPGFVIAAVGSGILGSQILGVILLLSHISASLILWIISSFFIKDTKKENLKNSNLNPAENFVLSVSESASSVMSICSFVILFSAVNSYIEFFSKKYTFLKFSVFLTEITNAVTKTNNIYIISFLLGFGGLCVWCQITALGRNIKIRPFNFVLFRILHGALSVLVTYLILKIFNITVPTLSNGRNFNFNLLYSSPSVAISLLIMCIIFIISISSKKIAGKIIEDML